jgi:hypothetical protein
LNAFDRSVYRRASRSAVDSVLSPQEHAIARALAAAVLKELKAATPEQKQVA